MMTRKVRIEGAQLIGPARCSSHLSDASPVAAVGCLHSQVQYWYFDATVHKDIDIDIYDLAFYESVKNFSLQVTK